MYKYILLIFILLSALACKSEPPLEKYITLEESINATAPHEFENNRMRFDGVKAVSRYKFKYFYTLLDEPYTSPSSFADKARPNIINSLKSSSMFQKFKEDNMTVIYSYRTKEGNSFTEIEIYPKEY